MIKPIITLFLLTPLSMAETDTGKYRISPYEELNGPISVPIRGGEPNTFTNLQGDIRILFEFEVRLNSEGRPDTPGEKQLNTYYFDEAKRVTKVRYEDNYKSVKLPVKTYLDYKQSLLSASYYLSPSGDTLMAEFTSYDGVMPTGIRRMLTAGKWEIEEYKTVSSGDTVLLYHPYGIYKYLLGKKLEYYDSANYILTRNTYHQNGKLRETRNYKYGLPTMSGEYDSNGFLLNSSTCYNLRNLPMNCNLVKYFYDAENRPAINIYDTDTSVYEYNEQGLMTYIWRIQNGEKTLISSYTYNQHHDLLVFKNKFSPDVEYRYIKYDPYGNWLRRTMYVDGIPSLQHERYISYY